MNIRKKTDKFVHSVRTLLICAGSKIRTFFSHIKEKTESEPKFSKCIEWLSALFSNSYNLTDDEFFDLLSYMMDETIQNNESASILNMIRNLIDEQLVNIIGRMKYERKYHVADRLKAICDDISIYTLFPELAPKNTFCIYEPNDSDINKLNRALTGKFRKIAVSKSIPTFVGNTNEVKVFGLTHKCVSVSLDEYVRLMYFTAHNNFDMAGVLYGSFIPSDKFGDNNVLLCIPENVDKEQKYYMPIIHSANILIISANKVSVDVITSFCNISLLLIYGNNKKLTMKIEPYCHDVGINIMQVDSFKNAVSLIQTTIPERRKFTSSFADKLDNQLCELIWHLANEKEKLNNSFEMINDNLFYKDDSTEESIRSIKARITDRLDEINILYHDLHSVSDEILKDAVELQNSLCMTDICLSEPIIAEELFIKKSTAFKIFPDSCSIDIIRKYNDIYASCPGCKMCAQVLMDDFMGNPIDPKKIKVLLYIPHIYRKSDFMKHWIIDLCENIADQDDNAPIIMNIIKSMHSSLTNTELRFLGKHFVSIGQLSISKQQLMSALKNGDLMAGEIYRRKFVDKSNDEMAEILADLGVRKAAMQIGKHSLELIKSSDDFKRSVKYLNMAAANGITMAVADLGDLYLNEDEEITQYRDEDENVSMVKALNYYLLAEKQGYKFDYLTEKIAWLYYKLNYYSECIEYCKKNKSGFTSYVLGLIYANGLGVNNDNKTALINFKKAADEGIEDAQTEYKNLQAKINSCKNKNIVNDYDDYSSQRYEI